MGGGKEMMAQAEAGLALFKEADTIEYDKDAAQAFKDKEDARFKTLNDEAEALTGKDNKKARQEKSKEAAAVKKSEEYIDAERVLKGLDAKKGHFVKSIQKGHDPVAEAAAAKAAAAVEEAKNDKKKKDDGKPKKELAAGISKAERDELEKLKNDIISRKKDESIVGWVNRMNELKEKENPGSTAKPDAKEKKEGKTISAEARQEAMNLEAQIEEYKQKLSNESKYSKKEIMADPDMMDMQAKLKKLSGKK